MKKTNKIILVLLLSFFPTMLMAVVSDELKRFNKCYALFVGERVKTSDPLWKAVETGVKSGTTACMEVFDRAKLDPKTGKILVTNGVPDEIGSKILNTFVRFHQSQLKVPDFTTSITGFLDRSTHDIFDLNETAYHYLYSVFAPGQKYSDLVTRNYSIRAIRYSNIKNRTRSILDKPLDTFQQGVLDDDYELTSFNPILAPTGKLMGFEKDTVRNEINNHPYLELMEFNDLNINRHIGGGAMGTQPYLIANIGQLNYNNGGLGLFRRWGKHVMEELLCRDLPALRSNDVISEVNVNSKIPFRTGISCMTCHSSMDPLSAVLRNGAIGYSFEGVHYNRIKFFGLRTPSDPYTPLPILENNPYFYVSIPSTRLFYRSYDGSLVKEEAVGIEELGKKMAQTNDLYVCAAKRYYQFLTGITVNLLDSGNINTPEFTNGEKFQRDRVIQMGLDLKKHQSGRELIKNIIQQKVFIYTDKGV